MKYPMLLLLLMLTTALSPLRAAEPERLIRLLNQHQNLEPVFRALDTRALADSAGLDENAAPMLEKLKPRLKATGLARARLAPEAAGVTIRLEFTGGDLNYLRLNLDDQGRLAGWYDYALGVSLTQLVQALAARAEPADLLKQVDEAPLQALGELPDSREGRVLSRLILAACADGDCYTRALARMEPLEPVRASLWRYEQAVQQDDAERARQALERLSGELGRDPGLVWLRAARALARQQCADVRAEVEEALGRWPRYQKLYPVAAQCAARARDWQATTRWFKALEQRFGQQLDYEALKDHPDYGDYLESEAFREWQDAR